MIPQMNASQQLYTFQRPSPSVRDASPAGYITPRPLQTLQSAVLTVASMHTAAEPITILPDPLQALHVTVSVGDKLSSEERVEDGDEDGG